MRWYLRFKLNLRDLAEIMAERGLSLAHTTIMRWVQHYAPEFEKRRRRYALAIGPSWRVDETYIKIRGEWCYLYRAADQAGRTIDFRLSARRDIDAAKAFFRRAMKTHQCAPQTITLDGYAASHRAVRELKADGSLPADAKLRSSKYLNNLIEQDHRSVKDRCNARPQTVRSPTMRQVHAARERLFVDYAGQTVEVVDVSTGELRTAGNPAATLFQNVSVSMAILCLAA